MSHKTAIKVYEIASYVLILGATAIYFLMKSQGVALTMLVLEPPTSKTACALISTTTSTPSLSSCM